MAHWSVIYYDEKRRKVIIHGSDYEKEQAQQYKEELTLSGICDVQIANGSDGGYAVANMGLRNGVKTEYDFLLSDKRAVTVIKKGDHWSDSTTRFFGKTGIFDGFVDETYSYVIFAEGRYFIDTKCLSGIEDIVLDNSDEKKLLICTSVMTADGGVSSRV